MKKWIFISMFFLYSPFSTVWANSNTNSLTTSSIQNCQGNLSKKNIDIVTEAYIQLDRYNNVDIMKKSFSKDYQLFHNNLPPQNYQQLYKEVLDRKAKSINIIATPFQDVVT